MENRYGLIRQSSGVWRSLRDGDFEEEDVWSVLKDRTTDHSSNTTTKVVRLKESSSSSSSPSLSGPKNVPTASRIIPKAGGSSSVNLNHEAKFLQQSAPVNIPNWPDNIYRHKSKKASKNESWLDDPDDDDPDDDYEDDDDDDDCYYYNDDDYAHKVPPHELIARRLAKSQIPSFSVFEGVGRTLKGRDLSKVRNAVLTKTGFLESL